MRFGEHQTSRDTLWLKLHHDAAKNGCTRSSRSLNQHFFKRHCIIQHMRLYATGIQEYVTALWFMGRLHWQQFQ
jgi:hypothetical protein